MKLTDANLLILTSTYPRWARDSTPGFVADFAHHIAPHFNTVYVLAPHYVGAVQREQTDNLFVRRYRYFFPASQQTIAYNGGAVSKIKKSPLYALKLLAFMTSLFFHTLYLTIFKKITIINAHWLVPQGFVGVLVKFLTGRKLVITIHGGDVLSLNSGIMRRIKRFILQHADQVCVNSSVTKAACQSLYKRPYTLIPMGINAETFASAKPSSALKKQYQLGDFTLLSVGRLSKEKGTIHLLEALQTIHSSGVSFKALIVGSGPLEDTLKSYIRDNKLADSIKMVGWVDSSDLPTYYKTANVMVGPSLFEAQGLVFLEALAAGLPVITTNSGGTVDFVTHGKNGLLVSPGSSSELASAIMQLHSSPKLLASMAELASHSIKARYSWTAVTTHYKNVFKELL